MDEGLHGDLSTSLSEPLLETQLTRATVDCLRQCLKCCPLPLSLEDVCVGLYRMFVWLCRWDYLLNAWGTDYYQCIAI